MRTHFSKSRTCFAVVSLMAAAAASSLAPSRSAEPARAGLSLAVLPLANASGDAGQEALADGLTEEVGGTLARVPGLHVTARMGAFRYKGQSPDAKTVGQALGATHLIEGTVRKVDDRIRLSAKLLRASDGAQLWSQDYYTQFSGIFDIEEDIATSVAATLKVSLGPSASKLVPSRTADMEAYENFLRARPLIRARGREPFAQAAVLLEQAVAKTPDFAPAVAMLAFDYDLAPLYQQSLRSGDSEAARKFVDSVIPKAEMLARRATQLDPASADAYLALAYAQMAQGRLLQADESFQKSLALDSDNTNALHGYSQLLGAYGRIKDSLAMRKKMQPLEPFFINYVADTAEIYWLDGDDKTAVEMLNQFRPGRTAELAQVQASLGHYTEAAKVLREMPATNYAPGILEAAAHLLETAPSKPKSAQDLPRLGNLGFVYLHAGAPERVMEYYESNLRAGYFQPISSTWFWHKSYAPVRKLERFKAYARNIGFADLWRARGWPAACRPVGANDFACD